MISIVDEIEELLKNEEFAKTASRRTLNLLFSHADALKNPNLTDEQRNAIIENIKLIGNPLHPPKPLESILKQPSKRSTKRSQLGASYGSSYSSTPQKPQQAESVSDFVARGGKIQVLPSEAEQKKQSVSPTSQPTQPPSQEKPTPKTRELQPRLMMWGRPVRASSLPPEKLPDITITPVSNRPVARPSVNRQTDVAQQKASAESSAQQPKPQVNQTVPQQSKPQETAVTSPSKMSQHKDDDIPFPEDFHAHYNIDPVKFKEAWEAMTPQQRRITLDWHREQLAANKIKKSLDRLYQLFETLKKQI